MARRKAPKGCFWRDGVLYGRIQAGGRDIKWSLRTDDPDVARARRAAERQRQIAIERYGDHRHTFEEALEAWGRFVEDQISQRTLSRYLTSLAILQPHLDGLYLDEIDRNLIGAIVAARRDIPVVPRGRIHAVTASIATIKRDLTALSSVMDFCVDEGWKDENPVIAWLKPGGRRKSRLQERRDPIVLPEPDHIRMVIAAAPGQFGAMIEAAWKTGARLDELAKAQRLHLDLDRAQLTVIGKRNKLRVLPLTDRGEDFGLAVFKRLPVSLECRSLFWHRPQSKASRRRKTSLPAAKAMPYKQASSNFGRIVEKVAIQAQKQDQDFRPFTFHNLRHRFAVDFLKSGRSIYELQQRLGHTSVKTTEIYLAYLTPEEAQIAQFGRTATGSKTGTDPAVLTHSKAKK